MSSSARVPVVAIGLLYAAAFTQGLMLVAFPASAAFFKSARGLTDAQYGLVFLPQFVCAMAGAAGGGFLVRRLGLGKIFVGALLATAAAQACLAFAGGSDGAAFFPAACSGAFTGLAFGLGAAPLNTFPALLLPRRAQVALVAVHTSIGLGLATGPVLVGKFLAAQVWIAFPTGLALLAVALALAAFFAMPVPQAAPEQSAAQSEPVLPVWRAAAFWGFVAVAVLYSFAEGIFANWSVIYLREERGVAPMTAALALSAFWAALAGGRLLGSALLLRVPARYLWRVLPGLMIVACFLLPSARSGASGIALFTLAGLACSAFFPLTIGLATERFPAQAATVSSLLVAALMFGNGLGAFTLGALREGRSLASLYAAAAVFPAAALLVGWRLGRVRAPQN